MTSSATKRLQAAIGNVIKPLSYGSFRIWPLPRAGQHMTQPWLASPVPAPVTPAAKPNLKTVVSATSNGIRVATQETELPVSGLTIALNVGTQNETDANAGVCGVLERSLLTAGTTHRSPLQLKQELIHLGPIPTAQFTRDFSALHVDCARAHVPHSMNLLTDVLCNSQFSETQLAPLRESYASDLSFRLEDDPYLYLDNVLHSVAYAGQGLGRSMFAENAESISAESISSFLEANVVPGNVVVAGVGIAHDDLVQYTEQFLGHLAGSQKSSPSPASTFQHGAEIRLGEEVDKRGRTHAMLAFKAAGLGHDDIAPLVVLQCLLGGGAAFSTGGPGKGMHSMLHQHVMSASRNLHSIDSVLMPYADQSLFYLHASAENADAGAINEALVKTLAVMDRIDEPDRVERAKNVATYAAMSALEVRRLVGEDVGRSLFSLQRHMSNEEIFDKLSKVTMKDLQRISRELRQSPPCLAVVGPGQQAVGKLSDFFQTK